MALPTSRMHSVLRCEHLYSVGLIRKHNLTTLSVFIVLFCRGIFNQGYLCSRCGLGAHKECLGRFGCCGKTGKKCVCFFFFFSLHQLHICASVIRLPTQSSSSSRLKVKQSWSSPAFLGCIWSVLQMFCVKFSRVSLKLLRRCQRVWRHHSRKRTSIFSRLFQKLLPFLILILLCICHSAPCAAALAAVRRNGGKTCGMKGNLLKLA